MRRKTLIIAVTQKDIDAGERHLGDKCPIARSLQRRFPNRTCEIDYDIGRIGAREFYVHDKIEEWMTNFDDEYATVRPTRFLIEFV